MGLTVVLSPDWQTYETWCLKNDTDHKDRKKVIPLVAQTDTYRLLGRNLVGARVVAVGPIAPKDLTHFKKQLKQNGWKKV
jgi:hypothetical protein